MSGYKIPYQKLQELDNILKQDKSKFAQVYDQVFEILNKMTQNYQKLTNNFEGPIVYIMGPTGSGKSTILNALAGKKLKVIYNEQQTLQNLNNLNYKPRLRLQLLNQFDNVGQIGNNNNNNKRTTLYPNIYLDPINNITFIENPNDFQTELTTVQQIVNNYFKFYLGKKYKYIHFLLVFSPQDILQANQQNQTKFIQYLYFLIKRLTIQSKQLQKSKQLQNYFSFLFTKINPYRHRNIIEEVQSLFIFKKQGIQLQQINNILQDALNYGRITIFQQPDQIYYNQQYAAYSHGKLFICEQLIQRLSQGRYAQNNTLKQFYETQPKPFDNEIVRKMFKKYSKALKNLLLDGIKQTFLQKIKNHRSIAQLQNLLQICQNSKILNSQSATSNQIRNFCVQMNLKKVLHLLEKMEFLYKNQGGGLLIIQYGPMKQSFQKIGIKKLLSIQTTSENSKNNQIILSGFNVDVKYPIVKKQKVIIRSLYQVNFQQNQPTIQIPTKQKLNNIVIIGPCWNLNTNFDLNLEGIQGDLLQQKSAKRGQDKPKESGVSAKGQNGGNGIDGIPGNTGKNGQCFLGVTERIIRQNENLKLTIKSQGGMGSTGQNGGDGGNGGQGGNGGSNVQNILSIGGQIGEYPYDEKMFHQAFGASDPSWNQVQMGGVGGNGGNSGKIGGGGVGGNGGIIQIAIIKRNKINDETEYIDKIIKQGPKGKNGQPGAVGQGAKGGKIFIRSFLGWNHKYGLMDPGPHNHGNPGTQILEVVQSTKIPETSQPVGYDQIIEYQKFILPYLLLNDIRSQVAFNALLKVISSNVFNHYKSLGKYSKLEIKHLISENNILCQLYKSYLYQKQNLFKTDWLIQLYSGFQNKLIEFVRNQFVSASDIGKQTIVKIVTNTHIAKKSLTTSFTVVNFDYLQYFFNVQVIAYQKLVDAYKKNYEKNVYVNNINAKINQAEKVGEQLQEQIKKITKKVDDQIKILQDELKKISNQKQQYAQKLRNQAPWKIMGNIFKFIGGAASYFGPEGEVVGASLNFVAGGIDSLTNSKESLSQAKFNPATYIDLDNGLASNQISYIIDSLDDIKDIIPGIPQKQTLENQLKNDKTGQNLKKYLEQIDKSLKNVSQIIEASKKIIKPYKQQTNKKDGQKQTPQQQQQQQQKKKQQQEDQAQNEKKSQEIKKYSKLKAAQTVLKAAKFAKTAADTISDSISFLDQVEKASQDSQKFKKQKNQLSQFIKTTLLTFMRKMKYINTSFSKLNSQPKIIFLQHGFRQKIKDLQQYFKTYLKNINYSQKDNFIYLFNKLDSTTNTISQIYTAIQNYRSQANLAYLIVISNSTSQQIQQKYPGFIQMQKGLQQLVILKQGNDILSSIKQSTFPMIPFYSYSSYSQILNTQSTEVNIILSKLKQAYKQKIINKNALTGKPGENYRISRTKMRFSSIKNKNLLIQLLKGQPIVYNSNVRFSEMDCQAIKFQQIYMVLQLAPPATFQQKEAFTKLLQQKLMVDFTVQMTSSGKYYYRYNGVYYNLPSAQLQLMRSYTKSQGVMNSIYTKVMNGEPIFSPYTTWKLQLKTHPDNNINLIQNLDKFIDEIQISLYGSGLFYQANVFDGGLFENLSVDESFKQFETNLIDLQSFDELP